jgi:hypothetical protein
MVVGRVLLVLEQALVDLFDLGAGRCHSGGDGPAVVLPVAAPELRIGEKLGDGGAQRLLVSLRYE